MSWSIEKKGTPKEISEFLDTVADTLSSTSKIEFVNALPHMKGIVEQNHGTENTMHLTANGHGQFEEGKQINSTLQVHLRYASVD